MHALFSAPADAPVFAFEDIPLDDLIAQAQSHDPGAVEHILERFRPLLRSRMHRLWTSVREELTSLEWADVEAQIHLMFLTRLGQFRPQNGVYFAHYIEQMLTLDCLSWLRGQRRGVAVPFSQLSVADAADPDGWLGDDNGTLASDVEGTLSLRAALDDLNDAQREAVWQCCVLGRTEDEVAARLGISRSAVRNRLQAGLTHLREHFHDLPDNATRTGRTSTKQALLDFRTEGIFMAKDEKRPDLIGIGAGRPILLQGVFDFEATGFKTPQLLSPKLRYIVPVGHVAGIRFVRVGAMCDKMVCLSTVVNGMPHRLIPVAANAAMHVPFAIVETIPAGSEIEIHIASDAPGTVVVDVGVLQMPA